MNDVMSRQSARAARTDAWVLNGGHGCPPLPITGVRVQHHHERTGSVTEVETLLDGGCKLSASLGDACCIPET